MKKTIILISALVLLALTTTLVFAAATPIVDGTGILSKFTSEWDIVGHTLGGLQVERGDGFVNFVLPRSYDHSDPWGVHVFVTFKDATVSDVEFITGNKYELEINGDDGVFGPTSGAYNDEVDWFGDLSKASTSLVDEDNELEMWMPTNSGRDGFKTHLQYGFCPRMDVEFIYDDPAPFGFGYGGADSIFEIGDVGYSYPSTIPLANCVVDIDIKPGSDPNCFNNDGNGVIPVAILGSADFDVYEIDGATLKFGSMSVAAKGKDGSKPLISYEDTNSDGYTDLVVKFEDSDGVFEPGEGTGTVTGNLIDGTPFEGYDSICVTQ